MEKLFELMFTDDCNYNCSYCVRGLNGCNPYKRKLKKRSFLLLNQEKFLENLKKNLKGGWEILILGGEPFLQPNFLNIIKKLVDMDYKIELLTNFSFPLKTNLKFIDITKNKLSRFNISLHLEYVKAEDFFKKAIKLKKYLKKTNSESKLRVLSVAVKEKLKELEKIGNKFQKEDIKFELQVEKLPSGRCTKYAPQEEAIIKKFGREDELKYLKCGFFGKKCWAGSKYFVMNYKGEAFRCFSALRTKNEYLGNILDGTFKLRKAASICSYKHCECITPYRTGMIE